MFFFFVVLFRFEGQGASSGVDLNTKKGDALGGIDDLVPGDAEAEGAERGDEMMEGRLTLFWGRGDDEKIVLVYDQRGEALASETAANCLGDPMENTRGTSGTKGEASVTEEGWGVVT